MLRRKEKKQESVDTNKINDVLTLSNKILKIVYILLVISGIYIAIIVCKELSIKKTILTILKTLFPLFIGIFVAWLFDPFVFLQRKGLKRSVGTFITYVLFIGTLLIIVGAIVPILSEQINEFVKMIPSTFDTIKVWCDNLFERINNINIVDAVAIKNELFKKIEEIGIGLTNSLPDMLVSSVKTLFSSLGTFIVGLIIGFYLLLTFNNANDLLITLLPKKIQVDARDLVNEVNTSLRKIY